MKIDKRTILRKIREGRKYFNFFKSYILYLVTIFFVLNKLKDQIMTLTNTQLSQRYLSKSSETPVPIERILILLLIGLFGLGYQTVKYNKEI